MTRVIFLLAGAAAFLLVWSGVAASPGYAVVAWAAVSGMIGFAVWQRAGDSRGRARISPVRAGVLSAAAAGTWGVRRVRGGGPAVSVRTTVPDAAIDELCLVWRRSDEELRRVPDDDPERGQLAEVRRLLLAEMERRDPAGFRRWLDNGAMTGTEPLAFLHPDHGFAEPGSAAAGGEHGDRAGR